MEPPCGALAVFYYGIKGQLLVLARTVYSAAHSHLSGHITPMDLAKRDQICDIMVHPGPWKLVFSLIVGLLSGFLKYFWDFWSDIRVFGQNNVFFELLQQKPCRIIYRFNKKTDFGSETCEIGSKVVIWLCPDLSRRTSTYFKTAEILFFWDFTPFPFLLTNFTCFCKQIYYFL